MVDSLKTLNTVELLCFVRTLCSQRKGQLDFCQLEQEGVIDVIGIVDRMMEKWGEGEALYIAIRTLCDINKRTAASDLESKCRRGRAQVK